MPIPEEYLKQVLEKTAEASEESLKILRKMNRARRFGSFISLLKWVFIIGASLWGYYYVEPYLRGALDTMTKINAGMEQVQNIGSSINQTPQNLLDKIQSLLPK